MGIEIIVDENQNGQTADVEPSELDELENEAFDDSDNQADDQQDSTVQDDKEEDEDSLIPERFRGKSRVDIAKSYSELEKVLGRQSTELGELRKLAEQYINKKVEEPAKQSQSIDLDELWTNPEEVIGKTVESKVKSFEEKLSKFEQENARREIRRLHRDAEQIVGSPEFQNWVMEDSVRVEKFRQANEKFDIDSADELFSEYKSLQEQQKATQKAKRDKELKAASTETSSTGQSSKKIYRRVDLQRLRLQNPDRFEALQPEIIKAYAEGRVR